MAAFAQAAERNFLLHAMRGFLERDLDIVAQIGTAARAATVGATTAAAENFVENSAAATTRALAENFAENVERVVEAAATETARATRAAGRALERCMAVTIVGRALVGILQHFVGLGDFLEHLLRFLVARILVRMELDSLLAVGLLDFLVGRRFRDPEQLVIIFLLRRRHGQALFSDSVAGPLETTTDAGRSNRLLRE